MLSKTQEKKKQKINTREGTQNTTRKKKKTKRTCARSFSTGEENMMGQKERYVLRITHATHFCYASTGPLLLPFETCRRPTTRTSQGMTHTTPPATHREHTHAHARQPHRARPPLPRHPHQHEGPHNAHTHNRAKGKGRHTHRATTPHHQKHRHHKHATHNTARSPRTPTHTTNTHNEGHPRPRNTPPQPAGPSQEWLGAPHHHRQRNPARSGGE